MSSAAVRLLLPVALCYALCGTGASLVRANEADDLFATATDHYSAKRWDLAVDEFRHFRDAYPDHAKHAKAMYLEAEALMQLDRNAEARHSFDRAISLASTPAEAAHIRQHLDHLNKESA